MGGCFLLMHDHGGMSLPNPSATHSGPYRFPVYKLPTFLLAFTSLHPSVRPKLRYVFAFVFFATRIVFHLVIAYTFIYGTGRVIVGRVPGFLIISIWPLHAYWFWGNLKGLLGMKKKKAADNLSTTVSPNKGSSLMPKRHNAHVVTAGTVLDTVDAVIPTEKTPSLPHDQQVISPPSPTRTTQHANVALSIQVRRGGQNTSLEKSLRLDFEGDVPMPATAAL
jgi:hypothetical protein